MLNVHLLLALKDLLCCSLSCWWHHFTCCQPIVPNLRCILRSLMPSQTTKQDLFINMPGSSVLSSAMQQLRPSLRKFYQCSRSNTAAAFSLSRAVNQNHHQYVQSFHRTSANTFLCGLSLLVNKIPKMVYNRSNRCNHPPKTKIVKFFAFVLICPGSSIPTHGH